MSLQSRRGSFLEKFPVSYALQVVLLLFHFYQTVFNQLLGLYEVPPEVHYSLFHLEFLSHTEVLLALSFLTAAFTGVALTQRPWAVAFAGIFGLLFSWGTAESHYSFGYYPSLALIAWGAAQWTKSLSVLIVFQSSVYLFAALHKLLHWNSMRQGLPLNYSYFLSPDISAAGLSAQVMNAMAVVVIPVELLIGSLFLFPGSRRYGFLLAALFHLIVIVSTGGGPAFFPVGLMLLLVHAAIALTMQKIEWSDVVFSKTGRGLFILALIGGVGDFYVRELTLLNGVFCAAWSLGPLIGLSAAVYFFKLKSDSVSLMSLPLRSMPALLLFAFWGTSPVLSGYRNEQLGWAMFSGASITKSDYSLSAKNKDCTLAFGPNIFIRREERETDLKFLSKQKNILEQLKTKLVKICPETEPGSIVEIEVQ